MYGTKDGRVVFTKQEAQTVLQVLHHAVEVVNNLNTVDLVGQGFPECRLLAALHTAQDSGVTIEALAALTAQPLEG